MDASKFDFIWKHVSEAMIGLKSGALPLDQAKVTASLARQANNVIWLQLEAAKFLNEIKQKELGL